MPSRYTKIPGHNYNNRRPITFRQSSRFLITLFTHRHVKVCFVPALLFLIPILCIVKPDIVAAEIQARGKTTITVLPILKDTQKPKADPAEQRMQVQRLQLGIKEHENKIRATREKGQSLLEELERIEATLKREQDKLTVLKVSLARQEKLLARERTRLNRTIADKQKLQTYVQNRLTAYYQMGGIGLMNVLFSKKSLSELLSFQEYFQRLLQCDRLAITSYQSKIDELTEVRRRHEVEEKHMRELVDKVRVREESLHAARQEKQTLLARVRTEEKLFQQAVAEIQQAADTLSAALAARSRPEAAAPVVRAETLKKIALGNPPPQLAAGHTFLSLKGKLVPPIDGTVVADHEGWQGKEDATSPLAGGIDIQTAKNEPIRAIYNGTVIASGYLRGYGNMIIIDHGRNYYSLIARAGEILKEEGTTVHLGDVIGITGDSDALLGSGLHFEIRHGSATEDPLEWLDRSRLDFSND